MNDHNQDSKKSISDFLRSHPYEFQEIQLRDGNRVWIQSGINPDDIFGDKRRSAWPFSEVMADLICEKVSEGASLTTVCKQPGFPSYNVVCRWRRENPKFQKDLKLAYADRAEFLRDELLATARSVSEKYPIRGAQMLIRALKWIADREGDAPANSGKLKRPFGLVYILKSAIESHQSK